MHLVKVVVGCTNPAVVGVMVNMEIREHHGSGRLRCPVRGERTGLGRVIELSLAGARLWVAVFEGSTWCLQHCRGMSVFLMHIP